MQSVFGLHDRRRFQVYCYSLSPSDQSQYRHTIERGADYFIDMNNWSIKDIVERIALVDKIHVLVNLNGYTKGGKNEIFAARPCPIQIATMGFAGTMGADWFDRLPDRWMDYLVGDEISCPPDTVISEPLSRDTKSIAAREIRNDPLQNAKMFTESIVYMPQSFFVNDHRQDYLTLDEKIRWRREQLKRIKMRHELFPNLKEDTIIYANFNQLYKIDPLIFNTWLNILKRMKNSILWLLRFPPSGENNLRQHARNYAGEEVASRVIFTDVAPKHMHIYRGRIADVFLDTVECNAHTTAADILWSGTPIITYPKYQFKMCSRVAARPFSEKAKFKNDPRLLGHEMVVGSYKEYEDRAVELGMSVSWSFQILLPQGSLVALRRKLFLTRDQMPLFHTARWVAQLEYAVTEMMKRWENGYNKLCQREKQQIPRPSSLIDNTYPSVDKPEERTLSRSIWVPEEVQAINLR
ncbi:hypothetical protein LY90DRAFT_423103 [Neocallimastix californiae]|uniref:O-GlcNAc transferase C-terminal domain-containing protein n=1 Tax=Neocallimastix californiae TaxID=1754190 RepID=A0A1Y2BD04_9FUNG|nr:hypothetical protein LY90DRAFT_423103 [Neocallimastix californiae]|eukprot:ORY32367.1 hypothetical protein LY90DRAFT_423103 [Neocallimastix californiae]